MNMQQLRAQIAALQYATMDENRNFRSAYAKGKFDALSAVNALLDSLQEGAVSDRIAFKAIPRLLEMVEPTDRAKAYTAKLADTLEVEGYSTDAKIVRESLKIMNGAKVPMATMDGESVSADLEEEIEKCLKQHNMLAVGKKDFTDIAKHFTNWQKELMLKNAIPIKIDSGGSCGPFNEGTWIQAILLSSKRINLGDKYKHMIIEVRED